MRLFQGDRFQGDEVPYHAAGTVLFQRVWKYGRVNLSGGEDQRPLATITADRPGTQLIAYSGRSRPGGPVDRFCKTVVLAGAAAPGEPLRWSEVGQRLEIVPQSDPVPLARRGGRLEVQVLYEREPLADVVVTALPQGDTARGVLQRRTDEIGIVRFELDRPGRWMIAVKHRDRCEDCGGASVESSASLVLAAGAGGS